MKPHNLSHSTTGTVILAGDSRPRGGMLASLFTMAVSSLAPTRAKRERKLWSHSITSNALREEIRQHNAKIESARNLQLRQRVGRQWDRLMDKSPDTFLNKSARRRMEG